jgi:hypothetical protein
MSSDRPISLGDLLRAWDQLDADGDPQTRRRIAALLGFEWSPEAVANLRSEATLRAAAEVAPAQTNAPTLMPGDAKQPPPVIKAAESQSDDAWVEALPSRSLGLPRWFEEVTPLPRAPDEGEKEPPAIDPLFRPQWKRALLYAALATVDHLGQPDVERIVGRLARGEPLSRIPRLPRLSLGAGVQVLIDDNKTMRPFAEDQRGLLDDIRGVISAELVRVAVFEAVPEYVAVEAEDWQWRAYQPPPRGTLVLALTDLGAGPAVPGVARGTPGAWLAFAERLRVAGCPFVALTPYPKSAVPPALRRRIATLPWDRSTTTAHIQRARRDASRGRS